MKGRDDAGGNVVDPDLGAGLLIGVGGVQAGFVGGGFVEVLADDIGFVDGEGGAVLLRAAEGGDEAARVEGEEGGLFVVGVDFNILVGDGLFFEGNPGALDEWAEPS